MALRRSTAVLMAVIALASGCSALLDTQREQCARDGDCTRLGLSGTCDRGVCVAPAQPDCDGGSCEQAQGEARGCQDCSEARGQVCFKQQCTLRTDVQTFLCDPPKASAAELITYKVHVQEFVSTEPLKALVVHACRTNDIACDDPVARFEDQAGKGDVELNLPVNFTGYLELRSDSALTSLFYFTQPLVESSTGRNLLMVAPSTLDVLAAVTGYAVDKSRGLVILEAFDCNGNPVGGVRFEESKKSGIPFFLIDSLPNTESTVTVRDEATNLAIGGFLNASPGFTVFTARLGSSGPSLGQYNANVRANTVTYVDIHP